MSVNSIRAPKLSAIVPRILLNKKEAFIYGRFLGLCSSSLFIQYRSEISGQRTRKTHAPFLRKRVLKNACFYTRLRAFARICAHLMRVFSFIIHSHQWHSSPSSLNKRQDKRQFLQTPLKIFPPTNKLPIRFWLCTWC